MNKEVSNRTAVIIISIAIGVIGYYLGIYLYANYANSKEKQNSLYQNQNHSYITPAVTPPVDTNKIKHEECVNEAKQERGEFIKLNGKDQGDGIYSMSLDNWEYVNAREAQKIDRCDNLYI